MQEVSKIRGDSERQLHALSRFHTHETPNRGAFALTLDAESHADRMPSQCLGRESVTLSSRNHGDFLAILSEITRKSRHFCAKLRKRLIISH
jgi:hypothetical protein